MAGFPREPTDGMESTWRPAAIISGPIQLTSTTLPSSKALKSTRSRCRALKMLIVCWVSAIVSPLITSVRLATSPRTLLRQDIWFQRMLSKPISIPTEQEEETTKWWQEEHSQTLELIIKLLTKLDRKLFIFPLVRFWTCMMQQNCTRKKTIHS